MIDWWVHLDPSSRYATIHQRHRQTGQAGWFLRPDCALSSERPQFRMPPVRNCPRALIAARLRAAGSIRTSRRASWCCSSATAGISIGANFKIYILRQFCSNRVDFLQYTRDTDAKMMDQNLKLEFCDFWVNFFKCSKRRHAVPLRPIWTIMVAAKLDQSRVLVTKFRQNRLTLKGRNAGQRQTDRQTNSAENKGPSGLQSGQQTDKTTVR